MSASAAIAFPDRAATLRRASRSPLARALQRSLESVPQGGGVIVAASGGADSTALALVAAAVASRGGWRVRLATVDHGLREGAREDAEFVERLGAWLGLPVDRHAPMVEKGSRLAMRARRARYDALLRSAAGHGASAVLFAHHAEDQLETVLMRLVRGTGSRSAGGMPARRRLAAGITLVRPFIERSRAELRSLLVAAGVPWCEDPSNADRSKPRGRLRHEVLPVLESMRPGAATRASRAARRVRGAAAALRARAKRLMQGQGPWARASLRRAPHEALAMAIRLRCEQGAEATIERAVEAIRGAKVEPRAFRMGALTLRVRAQQVSIERD